ncbi:MAG TPA: cobalamin-binding protein [Anaerolineales bacterium]|nr:cobalamin-binding protein [Anaerolineales bacterium]
MFRKLFVTILAAALLLTACAPAAAKTRMDGLNRPVELQGIPKRIVSLAPSNTEILFAIGAGKQVVGRDSFSNYPAQAASVQDIGGSTGKYDTEAIVALKPDLVLAGEINTPELVNSLQKLGLTVYYLPNPTTLEGMFANLETVGQLTGHSSEAGVLVKSLTARVAAVDARIKTATTSPAVYYELDATDPTKPYTAGPGTFVDLLLTRAGGNNVGKSLKSQWAQISLEQLVVANPSIIILGDAAYGTTPDALKQRAGWGSLAAVKNGQIYPIDDNLISRPGPRLVDGLEALAKLLHPEVYK